MILGIVNMKKDDDFFEEKQDPMLAKKVAAENDSLNTLIQPLGSKFQFHEKAGSGKYQIQKKQKTKNVDDVDEQFEESDYVGDGVFPSKYKPKKLNKKNTEKYEELSERSNGPSVGDPSSRGLN